MKKQLSPSQENYLERLYRASATGPVRISNLAEEIGLSLPSVSRAIKGLTETGLVRHKVYGRIELTEEGRALGQAIVRRDDLLQRLLTQVLGMTPEEADPQVHRLEHVLDEEVLERLEILVDCALTAEDWLPRLRARIAAGRSARPPAEGRFKIGAASIHAGGESERK